MIFNKIVLTLLLLAAVGSEDDSKWTWGKSSRIRDRDGETDAERGRPPGRFLDDRKGSVRYEVFEQDGLGPIGQGFGSQGFGPQGFGQQGLRPQGLGPQSFGSQGFGSQGFGSQGFGPGNLGPQGFGQQGFGPQGIRPQGIRPPGSRPQGLRPDGFGSQGLRPDGFGPQDLGSPYGERPEFGRPPIVGPLDGPLGERPNGQGPNRPGLFLPNERPGGVYGPEGENGLGSYGGGYGTSSAGVLTGPVPSWVREPPFKRYDTCKCTEKFNCQSPGISYGHCDVGKSYCCYNKHGGISGGPIPSRPINSPENGVLVGPDGPYDGPNGPSFLGRPDGIGPDGLRPGGIRPDGLGLRPDGLGLRPDGLRPDGLRPDGLRPDGLRPGGLRPDGIRPDGPGEYGSNRPPFNRPLNQGFRPDIEDGLLVGPGLSNRPGGFPSRPSYSESNGVLVGPGGPYDVPFRRPGGGHGAGLPNGGFGLNRLAKSKKN